MITPMTREMPLEMAAPATPRAGRPTAGMPLMRMALPPMFRQFMTTETAMVSFIIWLLRKKAVKVR